MFGDVIQKLRKEKNLSQSDLAEKLNVSNKIISNWETGKSLPDVMMMEDISHALDVPIEDLYNYVKENKTQHIGIDKKPAFIMIAWTCVSIFLIAISTTLYFIGFSSWLDLLATKVFVGLSIVFSFIALLLQVIVSFYVKLLKTNKYNKSYINKTLIICDSIACILFLTFVIAALVYVFIFY